MAEKRYLTEAQTAEYLGVSRSFLRKKRCYGGGPRYVKLAERCIRYCTEDLDAWVQENTVDA